MTAPYPTNPRPFTAPPPTPRGDEPCRRAPDRWFPEKNDIAGAAAAAAECRQRCPLLLECREWALANPTHAMGGVWGGLTHSQRRKLLRGSRPRGERARGTDTTGSSA